MALLLIVVSTAILWGANSDASNSTELGRRYASYDHEFTVIPFPLIVIVIGSFAFANLGVFFGCRAGRAT